MEVIGRETEGSKDTKRYVKLGQEARILVTWPNMPRLLFRVTPSIFMEETRTIQSSRRRWSGGIARALLKY